MLRDRTIRDELSRVRRLKNEAHGTRQFDKSDWLYGAEVALMWALGQDAMKPSLAFAPDELATAN